MSARKLHENSPYLSLDRWQAKPKSSKPETSSVPIRIVPDSRMKLPRVEPKDLLYLWTLKNELAPAQLFSALRHTFLEVEDTHALVSNELVHGNAIFSIRWVPGPNPSGGLKIELKQPGINNCWTLTPTTVLNAATENLLRQTIEAIMKG